MSVLKKQIKNFPSLHNFQKIIRYKLAILNIKNSDHLVDIHFKFLAKQGFQNIELFKKLFQNSNPHSLNARRQIILKKKLNMSVLKL